MNNYVALIRGIGPGNPNMSNANLCATLESLGLQNVKAIISSGNVIFSTPETDETTLEQHITTALQTNLQIPGTTIIRSQGELEKLLATKPFGNEEHSQKNYLTVTFFQKPTTTSLRKLEGARVMRQTERELCLITDTRSVNGQKMMQLLEKTFGKDITTRTSKTVERMVKKLQQI